jgi:hypothetical protein
MLSTKFRIIWQSGFRDLKKLTNQKQESPVAAMFVNGSRRNERSLQRTFHRCFLPSFSSFGRGVSEEKIKMWKVNGRQMTDGKWWQKLTLPLIRWAKNRWLLFLLSWILLASLITHKKNPLNSTIKLLSNDITWNHNIYMGPQVQKRIPYPSGAPV